MMDARDRILAAAPYSAALRRREPVTSEDIAQTLSALAADGVRTREDARVLAYAWYAGEQPDETIRLARTAGLQDMLRRELSGQSRRTYDEPQRFAASIENGGSELAIVRMFADENVGWAFALLHLILNADPNVVATMTGDADDVAVLVPMLWLIGWTPSEIRSTVLDRLLAAHDGFTLACATLLLAEWIRSEILGQTALAFDPSAVLAAAPKNRGLALFGGLVDEIHRWSGFARLNADAEERAERWKQRIDEIGRGVVVAPNDVDKVLDAAGARDVQALAAMSHWATSPDFDARTGERIARHAAALFKREFASFMKRDQNDNLYDAAHPEWVVDPLTEALANVGLPVEDFYEAFEGLACDAFSRMTRFMAWLRDRPRSIILLVIGGCVALRRGDEALLEAVREAAVQVRSQPASDTVVLDASKLPRLEEQLGFSIPTS
ncbi:MAG TPA: hypothetical protein VME66_16735 [Candidatus Acidoferrales bacterium]|nr:hypothetical protein [Candidatus Acidoferrales bacterium]